MPLRTDSLNSERAVCEGQCLTLWERPRSENRLLRIQHPLALKLAIRLSRQRKDKRKGCQCNQKTTAKSQHREILLSRQEFTRALTARIIGLASFRGIVNSASHRRIRGRDALATPAHSGIASRF